MTSIIEFKVTGRGFFPIDMLRYDTCWPSTQDDVAKVRDSQDLEGDQTVTLRGVFIGLKRNVRVEEDRWLSFGWRVIPGSVRVVG